MIKILTQLDAMSNEFLLSSQIFNPSYKIGLAVDKLGLIVQMTLLASQNLYIDSHVNFLSEPVSLVACTMPGFYLKLV